MSTSLGPHCSILSPGYHRYIVHTPGFLEAALSTVICSGLMWGISMIMHQLSCMAWQRNHRWVKKNTYFYPSFLMRKESDGSRWKSCFNASSRERSLSSWEWERKWAVMESTVPYSTTSSGSLAVLFSVCVRWGASMLNKVCGTDLASWVFAVLLPCHQEMVLCAFITAYNSSLGNHYCRGKILKSHKEIVMPSPRTKLGFKHVTL